MAGVATWKVVWGERSRKALALVSEGFCPSCESPLKAAGRWLRCPNPISGYEREGIPRPPSYTGVEMRLRGVEIIFRAINLEVQP